jgi:hypothetical protein
MAAMSTPSPPLSPDAEHPERPFPPADPAARSTRVRMTARFEDADAARRAVSALRVSHIPVTGRMLVPRRPTRARRFDRVRALWGLGGALLGGLLGAVLLGSAAEMMGLGEAGRLPDLLLDPVAWAAILGALLLGTLLCLAGLALSEPHGVAEVRREQREEAAVDSPPPGEVSLDLVVPDAESSRVRGTLVRAGAAEVRRAALPEQPPARG